MNGNSASIRLVEKFLLNPTGLSEAQLRQLLTEGMKVGVDSADLYLQYSQSESWELEEGIIKRGDFKIGQGFGARVISGDRSGFAHADELTTETIREAFQYAGAIVTAGQSGITPLAQRTWSQNRELYPELNPLHSLSEQDKVAILRQVDHYARQADPRVIQVNASLSGSYRVILVVDTDGTWAWDVRPLVHLGVSVIVEEAGRREAGSCGGGRRSGYEIFGQDYAETVLSLPGQNEPVGDNEGSFRAPRMESQRSGATMAQQYAEEAVRIALVNLQAIPSPAGVMPIVLGHGWPAVMLHEAVGHGLEADFNRKGHSVYAGRVGERVAASQVSVIDQGNLGGGRRGSLHIDDEGVPTQRTVLIEDGILKGYMFDKLNAKLMGQQSTGNGRRASYADLPIPRMTNTFMLAGKYDPAEILASVERGIYAVNFSGGQVDVTSGEFVFSMSEAYLIEKGRVTRPIKGATLIGNGPVVLNQITMVGDDLELDRGVGVCGKSGQSVPVGIGQPTLKIAELTVGGTQGIAS